MLYSYHTHTSRCRHADGTDEEYVIKAIAEGVRVLGFSDHAPYIYPEGYESYYKMLPAEVREYFASLRALREKYADKIKILIGYEAEYYPELWEKTLDFWRNGERPEYLILGQHYITAEYADGVHSMSGTDDPAMLTRYVDLIITGVNTGRFTYLAHPDLLNYTGSDESYVREMARICKAAKELDVPLEINLLGFRAERNYPDQRFWKLAGEAGCKVLLGCDAHAPEDFLDRTAIEKAMDMVQRYNLTLLESIQLRNI
jgi:histidinol-phosphatase (PHP family)